jgi:predicted dehydrogenase
MGAYDDLLARTDVDIVYNPLPNGLHRQWVERAAAAGKHVLCEKPLGRTEAEAAAMFAACRSAGVTLVEAYMTPFHPQTELVFAEVEAGLLGEVVSATTAFSFPLADRTDHRLSSSLGGGSSMDVGIYVAATLLRLAGWRDPDLVAAGATAANATSDATLSGWASWGAFRAHLETSFDLPLRQRFEVVGTQGAMRLERAFTPGIVEVTVVRTAPDGTTTEQGVPAIDQYRGMVDDVHAVVCEGATPRHPEAATLAVARFLDRLRAAAGVLPAEG